MILKEHEINDLIKQYLKDEKLFLAGRSGVTECEIVCGMILDGYCDEKFKNNALILSGISPNTDKNLLAFSNEYVGALKNMNMTAVMFCSENYKRLVETFCKDAIKFHLWGLEPYNFPSNPWSEQLENKRVLVIHPFEASILNNYKNREKLFPGTNILPKFELLTLKAHQNLSDSNSNWFDSLNSMKQKIEFMDFDVALVGCGAFGLPLGSFIKSTMGKSAIHMGGALQILFGILGKRWEECDNRVLKGFINNYWTRPLLCETPKCYKNVESGCYW